MSSVGVGIPAQSLCLGYAVGSRDVRERCFDDLTTLWRVPNTWMRRLDFIFAAMRELCVSMNL